MPSPRRYELGSALSRFILYCVVGGINTIIDLSIFVFLTTSEKMAPPLANVISYTTALIISFLLNRNFTFRATAYWLMPAAQFYRFVAVNLVSLAGSTAAIWMLSTTIVPIAAKLVTAPFVVAWGFLAVRLIVFRPKK